MRADQKRTGGAAASGKNKQAKHTGPAAAVAYVRSATSETSIFRSGASDAQVDPMQHARVSPCHPTRFTCSFTLYARAQIEFVRLCESAWTKGGRQVGLDIQVQLLESIHSQSTPDARAVQERRWLRQD